MTPTADRRGPRHVTLAVVDGQNRLMVNGEPFFVKGAGGDYRRADVLSRCGANALRTWNTRYAAEALDAAAAAGLMVLMGLPVVPERRGFDYDDRAAVAAQLDHVTAEVRRLKDHPALLAWGIGNELNLHSANPAVWDAVSSIAAMIHDVDVDHPVTTMLSGIRAETVAEITRRAPEVDFLSIQLYGGISHLRRRVAESGYEGPYLVTEWGVTGHWEVTRTAWGAPIEQTSSEKADAILERYRSVILGNASCMGSFVFLWGQKQERTPTWYGVFTEDGLRTETVDVMQYLWSGSWPGHRAPRISDVTVEGKGRFDDVRLEPGRSYTARLVVPPAAPAAAPDGAVRVQAEILPEATELGEGGDYEPRPAGVPDLIDHASAEHVAFTAPSAPGAYRLFVSVLNDHGHAATANLPFLVS